MADSESTTRSGAGSASVSTSRLSFSRAITSDMDSDQEHPELWLAGYGLLLAATAVFFLLTWDLGMSANLPVKLMLAAVLVVAIKRWTAALLLLLLQATQLFLGGWLRDSYGDASNVFWVCGPIAIISLISRYRTLQDHLELKSTEALTRISGTFEEYPPAKSDLIVNNLRGLLRQVARQSLIAVFCVVVAFGILDLGPNPRRFGFDTVGEFRLTAEGYRLVVLGLALFTTWLIAYLFVNEVVWRNRSAPQSRMYLRSVMLDWTHRDLRAVVRRRVHLRKKRRRKLPRVAEITDLPAASSLQDNPDELQRML